MSAVRLLYSPANEQGKNTASHPRRRRRRGNCRWPRRNYNGRFRIRAAAGAKWRLLKVETIIAIEIAAVQSRMSSIMGRIIHL
jgi:hypothetical protein